MARRSALKDKNPAIPSEWKDQNDIDLTIWDSDPVERPFSGGKTTEIRSRLRPYLTKILGNGTYDFDISFNTPASIDAMRGKKWVILRPEHFGDHYTAEFRDFLLGLGITEWNGAFCWNGYGLSNTDVEGSRHIIAIQRGDFRRKYLDNVQKQRNSQLQNPAKPQIDKEAAVPLDSEAEVQRGIGIAQKNN